MAHAQMLHEENPRDKIINDLGTVMDGIELFANQVLTAIYERPEKTKGGLILPGQTRNEDKFQGKAHLVVKMGPQAFVSTDEWVFHPVQVGDWVIIRPSDGWAIDIQGVRGLVHCRIIVDTSVKGLLTDPDLVW